MNEIPLFPFSTCLKRGEWHGVWTLSPTSNAAFRSWPPNFYTIGADSPPPSPARVLPKFASQCSKKRYKLARRYDKFSGTLELPPGLQVTIRLVALNITFLHEDAIVSRLSWTMLNGVFSVTFPETTPNVTPKRTTIS